MNTNLSVICQFPVGITTEGMSRKRLREESIQETQAPEKQPRVSSIALEHLPSEIISEICPLLNLPNVLSLRQVSKEMQRQIELLPQWKQLAAWSGIASGEKPFSLLAEHVVKFDANTIKTCAYASAHSSIFKNDRGFAIGLFKRLYNNQITAEKRAAIGLDYVQFYSRMPNITDRFKIPFCFYHKVMSNKHHSEELRNRASFSIIRLCLYYSPNYTVKMISTLCLSRGFIENLLTSNIEPNLLSEARLLNTLINQINTQSLEHLTKIAKDKNVDPILRNETKLHLIALHLNKKNPKLSPLKAYELADKIADDPTSSPEMRALAKYLAARLIAKIPEIECSKSTECRLLIEAGESAFLSTERSGTAFYKAALIAHKHKVKGIENKEVLNLLARAQSFTHPHSEERKKIENLISIKHTEMR